MVESQKDAWRKTKTNQLKGADACHRQLMDLATSESVFADVALMARAESHVVRLDFCGDVSEFS